MAKTPDGQYFVYLVNGEKYLVDHGQAREIKNYFEER